jgi:hypothetical protein
MINTSTVVPNVLRESTITEKPSHMIAPRSWRRLVCVIHVMFGALSRPQINSAIPGSQGASGCVTVGSSASSGS